MNILRLVQAYSMRQELHWPSATRVYHEEPAYMNTNIIHEHILSLRRLSLLLSGWKGLRLFAGGPPWIWSLIFPAS